MKVILFANTDWYLYNFRLPLARALREQGYQITLISPDGEYAAKIQAEGFHWRKFNFSQHGMNPFMEVNTFLSLSRFYKQEKPEIVHHFTIKCVLYGSIAAKFAKVPLVINAITGLGYVFLGGGKNKKLLRKFLLVVYKFALAGTQAIFQNSDDQKQFIDSGIIQENNSKLIRSSGVNIHYFTPQPESGGDPIVVLPARMLRDKGVKEFVDAARRLKAKNIKARFVLVGDVDERNPATISKAELDIWQKEKVVEWWGWQADMLYVYAQSSLVCLPSYREGVPRTLLEAGACARALVTTDVPGCREIVEDGVNGLLVPPRDVLALSTALEALILSPSKRREMGLCSREIIVTGFSEEKVIANTLALYQQISP